MIFNFIVNRHYENISTTKFSRFTVCLLLLSALKWLDEEIWVSKVLESGQIQLNQRNNWLQYAWNSSVSPTSITNSVFYLAIIATPIYPAHCRPRACYLCTRTINCAFLFSMPVVYWLHPLHVLTWLDLDAGKGHQVMEWVLTLQWLKSGRGMCSREL